MMGCGGQAVLGHLIARALLAAVPMRRRVRSRPVVVPCWLVIDRHGRARSPRLRINAGPTVARVELVAA